MNKSYKSLYKSNKIAYDTIQCPSDDAIILETQKTQTKSQQSGGGGSSSEHKKDIINNYVKKYIKNKQNVNRHAN